MQDLYKSFIQKHKQGSGDKYLSLNRNVFKKKIHNPPIYPPLLESNTLYVYKSEDYMNYHSEQNRIEELSRTLVKS